MEFPYLNPSKAILRNRLCEIKTEIEQAIVL